MAQDTGLSSLCRRQSGLLECLITGRRDLGCRRFGLANIGVERLHAAGKDNVVRCVAPALDGNLLAGVTILRDGHGRAADLLHDVTGLEILKQEGHGSASLGYGILAPGCLVIHGHISAIDTCYGVVAPTAVEHVAVGCTLEFVGLVRALEHLPGLNGDAEGHLRPGTLEAVRHAILGDRCPIELDNTLLDIGLVDGEVDVLGLCDVFGQLVYANALSLGHSNGKLPFAQATLVCSPQQNCRAFRGDLADIVDDFAGSRCLHGANDIPSARDHQRARGHVQMQGRHVTIGLRRQGNALGQGNALFRCSATDNAPAPNRCCPTQHKAVAQSHTHAAAQSQETMLPLLVTTSKEEPDTIVLLSTLKPLVRLSS